MLIKSFLTIQNQLRILHWQTTSYAQHKALGSAYEDLDELVDDFIEIFAGGDRSILEVGSFECKCHSIDSISPLDFMSSVEKFVSESLSDAIPEHRSDLHNIKDEMLAVVNKTKYLLNLK
jgi:hypothetical protein